MNPAAHRALLVLNHCTPREAAKLFGELGGMNPSSSHLKRLLETTGSLWKEREQEAMDSIREAETGEAVSCAVSLDGVMVPLRPDGDEEACWREASCGTVSFQNAEGNRLKTLSFGPEAGKATAQLAEEIAHVRKVRPELVAVADAAPDNWTFLEKLRPDEQAVDFFHAISARFPTMRSRATGTKNTAPRDDVGGIDKVGDPLSPRQGDDGTGAQGSQARTQVFPQEQTPHALREPQGQRLRAPASSKPPTRSWSTSA